MSGSDVVPHDDSNPILPNDDAQQHVPRKVGDPFSPEGMPLALLEFHSPSAALVNLPATPAAERMVWVVAAMFLFCVVAMAVYPLDEVISTPGRMISTEPTIQVQPLETAIIRSIDVHVGDFVHKGQVIAHLDPTISEADVTNMRQQRDGYQAEVDRLTAEAEDHPYVPDPHNPASTTQAAAFERRSAEYKAHVSNYDQQIAGLQSDLQGYEANAAMYASRAKLARDVYNMRLSLQDQKVGSRLSTLQAQSDLMESERSQIGAQQSAQSTRSKLQATRDERESYIQNWKAQVYSDLSIGQHRLDEARSDYDKAALRRSLIVLRANEDSVVLTIAKVSVGSVLSGGGQLMTLVPVGSGLEMEAMMRGQDAGFVHVGDHAVLKFTTFPYDQYGGADATVRVISADSFAQGQDGGEQEASGTSAMTTYYRVRLRIDRYTLHGVPEFFHPSPGMPVTADIDVGKRTPLRYLLNRMVPAATNGMREP
jgi:hemolysin D